MAASLPGNERCFVIMPFGEKTAADGTTIDFDDVYENLIKNTVESLGIECIRCDKIDEAGWIHAKMFEHVYRDDIAVVDITGLNPNVFYELGVRHALADCVTVLIRRAGTNIPFNISSMNVIDYDLQRLGSVEEAKKKLGDYIRNGLQLQVKDSPVYDVLELRIDTTSPELTSTQEFSYKLRKVPDKEIGVITGDLRDVKGIDVWVNSENTNMIMARPHDRSISSVIRYYGAKRKSGKVVDDLIADELTEKAGDGVPPGEVVVTGAGELEKSNKVKKIFHVAAVVGQVGKGYTSIPDITECVRNALVAADDSEYDDAGLKTMLFPILGTGTGRGQLEQRARELIGAAIGHLERHPPCRIERVYFLAWTERDLAVCQRILQESPQVTFS